MEHFLWLVYEQPPHGDAVAYPASVEDLRVVLALLKLTLRERTHLSELLRNWLAAHKEESPFDRPSVAVRFGEGLYHPLPWRLAKWLACILPIHLGGARMLQTRIQHWLENREESQTLVLE